jgi:hypothetical protein
VALSFLALPDGIVTRTWAHPRSVADFACEWRTEIEAARRLGQRVGSERYLEVRYEALVADPEHELRRICSSAGLEYEADMLLYDQGIDLTAKPHQRSLARPLTPGLRDWRTQMSRSDVAAFEDVAGELLDALGYEVSGSPRPPSARARARLASYRARSWAWRTAGTAVQRSPLWRSRHPPLV